MTALRLTVEELSSPLVERLIGELDRELNDRYPLASVHGLSDTAVMLAFVVAWQGDEPVGCGSATALDDESVEVKRMYVRAPFRGQGISREILTFLEERARELGYGRVCLETGDRQPEAMGLYESSGYSRIANFGEYIGDPHSVCYAKLLKS